MSLRRVGVLIGALPPESATISAITDDTPDVGAGAGEPRGWSVDQHLLATIVDAINANTWTLQSVNSDKPIPVPEPMPRPGVTAQRTVRRLSPEDRERIRRRNRGG